MKTKLAAIRRLVGPITNDQLRYVDCFVAEELALFMPAGGACFYALQPEHSHPAYMFILHFNERIEVKMDGKIISGRPGRIFALSPGIPHQELPSDTPPRYIGMFISKRLFEKHYKLYSRGKPGALRGTFLDPCEGLLHLLKRFMTEADLKGFGSDTVLNALGIEICHSLIRAIIKAPSATSRIADRIEVNRAVEFLTSHLDGKITVKVLASVAHLSASHFARVFKEETGMAPMEYVHEVRLARAKKLLLAGDRSVTEIALACGFGTPSYLSACFRKQYKITPSELRKSLTRPSPYNS